jgi:hypothetical protein
MADLGLTAAQLSNARAIVAEGKARGASELQIRIALMTALTESNLLNYANRNNPESLAIPHEAVGQDHASVGVFQQQVGIWGDTKTLMNVRASAAKFFDALKAAGAPNAGAPWITAQKVQRSAFSDGSNYAKHWTTANSLYETVKTAGTGTAGPGLDVAAPGHDGPLPVTWLSAAQNIGDARGDPAFWRRAGLFALGALLLGIVAWNIVGGSKAVRAGVKIATKGAV